MTTSTAPHPGTSKTPAPKSKLKAKAYQSVNPSGGKTFKTQDIERGKRVASRIDTGMVFIHHPTWTTADLPFGGIKNSGYGRELSSLGIQEFVNKKLVRVDSIDAQP